MPCSELVQWFVLQQPLHVPAAFMFELHHAVHGEGDEPVEEELSLYTQPLNGLEVMVQTVCDGDRDRQAHNTDQL